jgi:hypothetical protein
MDHAPEGREVHRTRAGRLTSRKRERRASLPQSASFFQDLYNSLSRSLEAVRRFQQGDDRLAGRITVGRVTTMLKEKLKEHWITVHGGVSNRRYIGSRRRVDISTCCQQGFDNQDRISFVVGCETDCRRQCGSPMFTRCIWIDTLCKNLSDTINSCHTCGIDQCISLRLVGHVERLQYGFSFSASPSIGSSSYRVADERGSSR